LESKQAYLAHRGVRNSFNRNFLHYIT